jgi:hypothetical protein
MSSDLTAANHLAIQNAGYIVERVENNRGEVTLRAKDNGEVVFSVTAPDDKQASTKLLALINKAPRPGSPEAAQQRRREAVSRPDLWSEVLPKNPNQGD